MPRIGLVILLLSFRASAQFTYTINQDIPVEIDGQILSMPWAGGLNSAQFNTIDLNADNKNDLVVFDRASGRISTFLNVDNAWR